eukprot:CAMPEP_0198139644 /NCGR_PEP_ID=MMETSP1443-20131203/2912_1 /TAXON_ID=186043 /ORGANISM="Entomoneis sp., Strain CCMP2396" /LENGTH=510 /DNA_ID=CAMNT_0043801833 /DNA_START=148 /DNA_END=1680 /DNA_ORIENTATION=-
MEEENDNEERRQAELEFVTAAYEEEEAWCCCCSDENGDPNDACHVVRRRLFLNDDNYNDNNSSNHTLQIQLTLTMVSRYPSKQSLQVSVQLLQQTTNNQSPTTNTTKATTDLIKLAYDSALPDLLSHCRTAAVSVPGEEAVFVVLAAADEWIAETWPTLLLTLTLASADQEKKRRQEESSDDHLNQSTNVILGRRLIYSHHIISNQKRRDIQDLAKHYNLTGYIKIGWPGLIVIEGLDDACNHFYDDIRKWAWQYLVVRGEMQETCHEDNFESQRRFCHGFQEVDDMSIVADACRQANLESLFKTSMKIYDNNIDESTNNDEMPNSTSSSTTKDFCYATLMYVDHMNNGKGYRKWLRKNASELDLWLWIRHLRQHEHESSKNESNLIEIEKHRRGPFVVAVRGYEKTKVGTFLKRWRSSRVDVDSKGKPCLERKMHVLVEGYYSLVSDENDTEDRKTTINNANSPHHQQQQQDDQEEFVFKSSRADLVKLVQSSMGSSSPCWVEAIESCF